MTIPVPPNRKERPVMTLVRDLALGLRFLLEMAAIVAVGW